MTQGTGFTAMAGPKAEGEALQVGVGMLGYVRGVNASSHRLMVLRSVNASFTQMALIAASMT
jgi:hypothetical protein